MDIKAELVGVNTERVKHETYIIFKKSGGVEEAAWDGEAFRSLESYSYIGESQVKMWCKEIRIIE